LNHTGAYQAARAYADYGWPVFPVAGIIDGHCGCKAGPTCHQPGKHPLNSNGLKGATTDPGMLRRWWRASPWAGVAVRIGSPSGLVVVDVDARHGGVASMVRLREAGKLPAHT